MKQIKHILLLFTLTLSLSSFTSKEIDSQLEKAYAAEDGGQYQQAIDIYNGILTGIPKDSLALISDIYTGLANCHFRMGQMREALNYGEQCLQIDEKDTDKERLATSLGNLAALLLTADRLP